MIDEKRETDVQQKAGRRPVIPFSTAGAASALYALLYTFCLYKNAAGITYPFFVAGTLCCFSFCMKKYRSSCGSMKESAGRAGTAFYAGSILLLGISVCLTDDFKVHWMTMTGIFFLTLLFVLRGRYVTKHWTFFRYLSAMGRSLLEMFQNIDTPITDAWVFFREKKEGSHAGKMRYVLLGLLVGLPLAVVVLALLLSADAVFYEIVTKAVGEPKIVDWVLIGLMFAAGYVLFYSFVRGLTTNGIPEQRAAGRKGEPMAAITFTSLLAVIYLAFCMIQVVYLFGGRGQLPEGLTWAFYARQGFFQLLFVCLINLAVVLFCMSLFEESRILKTELTAISLMTYIMMASSAYRMLLYIQAYYLTFLRLFVLWALAVIAVVFAGVLFAIYRKNFPLFRYCTVVVTCFYLVFAFAKPDYWVAKYDLAHMQPPAEAEAEAGPAGYEDTWYLSGLSADAAPVLLDDRAESGWRNSNEHLYYYKRMQERTKEMGWRTFNLSRWMAKKELE